MVLEPGSEEEAAFRVIVGVYEAYQNLQPEKIEAVQVPEYSVWDGTLPQLFQSRAEVKAFHQKDQDNTKARGPFSFDIQPLKIDILGDVAVVLSRMDFQWQPPNAWSGGLRITDVMRKVDGHWMMFHHHESVEPEGYTHI
jgi:ketosteroid isomerase-like protein